MLILVAVPVDYTNHLGLLYYNPMPVLRNILAPTLQFNTCP